MHHAEPHDSEILPLCGSYGALFAQNGRNGLPDNMALGCVSSGLTGSADCHLIGLFRDRSSLRRTTAFAIPLDSKSLPVVL
jgi:hypothetical protein